MSQGSIMEEYCPIHNDLYVAYNNKKEALVCNHCIYIDVEDMDKAFE